MLVDQAKCRDWPFCVSDCPYKKLYFNHRTGKAEKCTLCLRGHAGAGPCAAGAPRRYRGDPPLAA